MIINSFTVIMLFVSLITALLSLMLFFFSIMLFGRIKTATPAERGLIEERSHLLLLIAVTVFIIKLLLWPFLYVVLQSYIPMVQGAMCIFGVTQVQPLSSAIIQIIKPFVFFSLGSWLIINKIDERTERSLLKRKGFLLLGGASLLSLFDSLIELRYLTGFDIKSYVACCTTVFDLPERRFTAQLTSVFVGKGYQGFVMPLYYLSNIFLLFLMVFTIIYYQNKGRHNLSLIYSSGLMSLINSVITVIATFERIAPEVMRLPDHHCLYCLWQYAPLSILFSIFFIIGTFSPIWASVIQFFRGDKVANEAIDIYTKRLYVTGILMIGLTTLSVTVYKFV